MKLIGKSIQGRGGGFMFRFKQFNSKWLYLDC